MSEQNVTIRSAGMQILLELSELEQVIFTAHYDKDPVAGSPRKAWIRVGLIDDLSILVSQQSQQSAKHLRAAWQREWPDIAENVESVNRVSDEIDKMRIQIKHELSALQ